jgi:hypothetical protein
MTVRRVGRLVSELIGVVPLMSRSVGSR